MAGSGTRCQRWIAPTTAEYRPGSAIYGAEHCRSKATLVVGSIPVTDGALSILRAGLGNVRESFAILRSASNPERDRPNRSAVVRSPAPAIRFPPNERPMPNLYFAPADVGGDPSPSSARDGRRRIILTASAPQNGKALPHDPDPNRVVAPPASRSDRR